MRFHHIGMVPVEVSVNTVVEKGWEKKVKRLNEMIEE